MYVFLNIRAAGKVVPYLIDSRKLLLKIYSYINRGKNKIYFHLLSPSFSGHKSITNTNTFGLFKYQYSKRSLINKKWCFVNCLNFEKFYKESKNLKRFSFHIIWQWRLQFWADLARLHIIEGKYHSVHNIPLTIIKSIIIRS